MLVCDERAKLLLTEMYQAGSLYSPEKLRAACQTDR